LALQAEKVGKYVIQLLRGEASAGSQVGRPLTPAAYTALLPTIWSFINQPSPNQHQISSSVLQATLEHATKTSSKSATKKLGIEFVGRLILVSVHISSNAVSNFIIIHASAWNRARQIQSNKKW
jgi:pre-rRNA-processing protein IPI1